MRNYTILILVILLINGCSQSSKMIKSNSDKYFDDIFQYHMKFIEENDLTFAEYLQYTKPFGILDCRPLNMVEIELRGDHEPISVLPNYIYGGVANKFDFPVEVSQGIVQVFNQMGVSQIDQNVKYYKDNVNSFDSLRQMVVNNDANILFSDSLAQRVGECFYYKGRYLKYVIPEGSPFTTSDSLVTVDCSDIFLEYQDCFNLMKSLQVTAIYKSDSFLAFVTLGMLDNSRGYIVSLNGKAIDSTPLFNYAGQQLVEDNVFYYVAY